MPGTVALPNEAAVVAAELVEAGYEQTDQVEERGQFALRGGLLDLFPATEERAVRVDMFDVEIESLRWFSTFTQRSLGDVDEVEIAPAAELASMLGQIAETPILAVPVPDSMIRAAGAVLDKATPFLPFDTPFTSAGMQYYTQMPSSDDSPSEQELGITYRDPRDTVADIVAALRSLSS